MLLTHPLIHSCNTFTSENVTYKSAILYLLQTSTAVEKWCEQQFTNALQNHFKMHYLFHITAIPLLEHSWTQADFNTELCWMVHFIAQLSKDY